MHLFLASLPEESSLPLCTFFLNRGGEGRASTPPPLPSLDLGEVPSIAFPRWQTPSWICLMTQIYLAWTL